VGQKKIVIIGNEGSGKSSLASELAAALGVPHIEVEAVSSLELAIPEGKGWVVEGMRRTSIRDHALPTADLLIWLDLRRARVGGALIMNAVIRRLRSNRGDGMRSQSSFRREVRSAVQSMRRHGTRRKRFRRMFEQAEGLGVEVIRVRTRRGVRGLPKQICG
jgi:cytidylate kinase